MNDLNFFEPYIKKRKINMNKQIIYYSVIILLIIIFAFYVTFNQIKIKKLSKDITTLKTISEDIKVNRKIDEILERKKEIDDFRESLNDILLFDETLEENNIIDNYLLETITYNIPDDIFFTSITIYINNIQVIGIAENRESIPKLGKSLESIEEFREVFISSISKSDQYYSFILNISLKDVNTDGENSAIQEDENQEITD